MQIINMFKTNGSGKIKAFFTVDLGPIAIRDVKLIEGDSGLWAAMPSREYTAKDGQKKWAGIVQVNNLELLDKISRLASSVYNGGEQEDSENSEIPF